MRLLITILLCLPLISFAQSKHDNTIQLNKPISFVAIKAALFQSGYMVTEGDSVIFSTSSKELYTKAIAIKFMFYKTDSSIFLKGLAKPMVQIQLGSANVNSDFTQVEYGGMKGSELRNAWNEMDRIAKLLSPYIVYLKQ